MSNAFQQKNESARIQKSHALSRHGFKSPCKIPIPKRSKDGASSICKLDGRKLFSSLLRWAVLAPASIAEQLFQTGPSRFLPRVGFFFAGPGAPDKFEIFAKVGDMFFRHGIGAAVVALVRQSRFIARAVEANFEIGPAMMATLGSARQAG